MRTTGRFRAHPAALAAPAQAPSRPTPGHSRASVVGETILTLKARLWFVHHDIEKLFEHRTADGGLP
jgi:Ni,Fe-hydrogenase III large subunit